MLESLNLTNLSTTIIVDGTTPSGVLGKSYEFNDLSKITNILNKLKRNYNFQLDVCIPNAKDIKMTSKKFFGSPFTETHCFRGYPTYGSFKQFCENDSDYILHFDCDMLFYQEKGYSWIKDGISVMERNEDILCVLPRGGPPNVSQTIHQGTTDYKVDNERGLFLFKNFTSRHYLIHRKRFLNLLPIKPLWLSWREPLKSKLFGNGKMLCWETMIGNALENSNLWRADLMTEQSWSLHPGDRCKGFHERIGEISMHVQKGNYPKGQEGHFDLRLKDWETFILANKTSA